MDATASRPPDLRYSKLHFILESANPKIKINGSKTITINQNLANNSLAAAVSRSSILSWMYYTDSSDSGPLLRSYGISFGWRLHQTAIAAANSYTSFCLCDPVARKFHGVLTYFYPKSNSRLTTNKSSSLFFPPQANRIRPRKWLPNHMPKYICISA